MINRKPIDPTWFEQIGEEFSKPYMVELRQFLKKQYSCGKRIYPHKKDYFAAFNRTPFDQVRVVILGQDPYHGPGQAHGLSFSVLPGVKPPPSLVNINKELKSDLGIINGEHGCLTSWADQGVLLLNSVLTVNEGEAASHRNQGWEQFTDEVIKALNQRKQPMVFLLWGSYAQKKGAIVNPEHHLVLKGPHPSPLSAYRGFFGCSHFSKANKFLIENKMAPIDWELPPLRPAQDINHEHVGSI